MGTYRADYAWPRIKVILEFDGRGKYYDYRPTAEALLLERRRETALMDLGWRVVRLTWADLERPDLVAARLAAAFEAAA
ncbi:endonuclease domain-containing protein [Sinomonas gamaensis]|uniref:endonuclease domain-containing protein n=1 Tax=Sinomonas gamaensis TaxID=2565624 RepID=UPI002015E650|nr:endonuclease domain-containing protein [Sinomonas gamaensis]